MADYGEYKYDYNENYQRGKSPQSREFYDDNEEEDENESQEQPTQRIKLRDKELEEYGTLLAKQMAENKLVEAQKAFDAALLKQAIDDHEQLDIDEDEDILEKLGTAKQLYDSILISRKLLREARHAKKPTIATLKEAILRAKNYKVKEYVKDDIDKALRLIEKLNIKDDKITILAMDKKTMAEIKRYVKPSPTLHLIMKAALLLLREDEGTTEKWSRCQALCNPDGERGMLRKMLTFDPSRVHPEIAKRARYLLRDISLAQAHKASPAAGTFFVWTKRVIGDDPTQSSEQKDNDDKEDEEEEEEEDEERDQEDDESSIAEERSNYEKLRENEERKKREYEEYVRNLPKFIALERKIFADQEAEERMEREEEERRKRDNRLYQREVKQGDEKSWNEPNKKRDAANQQQKGAQRHSNLRYL